MVTIYHVSDFFILFFFLLSLPLTHLTLFFSFPFSPHSHRSTLSHFIRSTLSPTHATNLLAYNSNSKPFRSSLSPNRFSRPIRSCFSPKLNVFMGLSGIPNSQFLQFRPKSPQIPKPTSYFSRYFC